MKNKKSYYVPFILVTSLFFLWGFAHNLDPILIPHLKKSFSLTTTQSTLVDSAVFIAYFIMAVPAGFLMDRLGYKAGIIIGLLLFASGCFLFIPAANYQSYSYFLIALFIIACGLTTLETAANPYATALGDPADATFRLNLAQSFNGLAAALAPVIGARLILTDDLSASVLNQLSATDRQWALAAEASTVKLPYTILGIVLVVIALLFALIRLPDIKEEDGHQPSKHIFHAFKHAHLKWAVVAQFFYVGAQVSIFSLFILFATKSAGLTEIMAADYLGICGIVFLAGRFIGTALMRFVKPPVLLTLYSVFNIVLCLVAITASGIITVYAVIGICFFMSIMFPTIFALGISNLKGDTAYGSSLLIMAIVGGAVLPRIFGLITDLTANIQLGYLVPLGCFAVILFFGWKGHRVRAEKA